MKNFSLASIIKEKLQPSIDPPPVRGGDLSALRSNIDQFWKNPEDLENDLYNFIKSVSEKDPKLAKFLIHKIKKVLLKFNTEQRAPAPRPESPPSQPDMR